MADDERDQATGAWSWAALGESAPSFDEELIADDTAPQAVEGPRYDEQAEIGRGGMGLVRAVFDRRLQRQVARKELRWGQDAARLQQEAEVTARLEHPNIVPVYNAGQLPDGRPFYTMRLIRGRSLGAALASAARLEDRLALLPHFLSACQAVAFAHSSGVIHRDLKPDNIMVGAFGETQVVDWGLARLTGASEPARPAGSANPSPVQTSAGSIMGTPAYMSPEQARGLPVDARADVWSLGAMLYELLTGAPPFVGDSAEAVLADLRAARLIPARERAPDAPPELAAITACALARDPGDRYPSARELADDVARHLSGRRVQVYPYSSLELLQRLYEAWRVPLWVAAAALVVLAAVLAGAWSRTSAERDRALLAEEGTRTALELSDQHLARAMLAQARTALRMGATPEAGVLAAHVLRISPDPLARGILAAAGALALPRHRSRAALPACQDATLSPDGSALLCRTDDRVTLWRGEPLEAAWSQPLQPLQLAFAGDSGKILAVLEGEVVVLDGEDGRELHRIPAKGLWQLTVSPGGRRAWLSDGQVDYINDLDLVAGTSQRLQACPGVGVLATALHTATDGAVLCYDSSLSLWEEGQLREPRPTPFLDTLSAAELLTYSPDGRWIAGGTLKGEVALLDARTGAVLHTAQAEGGIVRELVFSPDSQMLAVNSERNGVRLWSPAAGAWIGRLPLRARQQVLFSDETTLLTIGRGPHAPERDVWQLLPDTPPRIFYADSGLTSAAPSLDGQRLATTHGSGQVHLWSVRDGALTQTLIWQERVVKDGGWSVDGQRYAAAGMDSASIQIYTSRDGALKERREHPVGDRFRRVRFLRSGLLGLSFQEHGLMFWPTGAGQEPLRPLSGQAAWDLATDHTGEVAVIAAAQGVYLLHASDPAAAERISSDPSARAVDVAAGGATVAIAHRDAVTISESGTVRAVAAVEDTLIDVALSPDARWVAAGGLSGAAWLWDVASGELLAELRDHTARVSAVEFAADGTWLVTGSWDGTARRWDLRSLTTPPDVLVAELEAAWGMGVDEVLSVDFQ